MSKDEYRNIFYRIWEHVFIVLQIVLQRAGKCFLWYDSMNKQTCPLSCNNRTSLCRLELDSKQSFYRIECKI